MRFFSSLAAVAILATAANAHFIFVYVTDDGAEARVVFGHTAAPDPSSFPTRAEKTELTARDAAGKDVKLKYEKGNGNYYRSKLDGKPVVVFGTTFGGVVQRGDNPASLSHYYPKVIVGDPCGKGVEIGKAVPLEIVPVRDGAKLRFKAVFEGKPLAEAEVTVVPPGQGEDGSEVVKTDKDGLSAGYAKSGRYCVAVRKSTEKAGEADGKKYTVVRLTASLVCDFGDRSKRE